jgi:hypothetical protein
MANANINRHLVMSTNFKSKMEQLAEKKIKRCPKIIHPSLAWLEDLSIVKEIEYPWCFSLGAGS